MKLEGFSEPIHIIKQIGPTLDTTRATDVCMTKIAIPSDLARMFATCENAYEQATREGYAENPAVIAAVSTLKSAWAALHVANRNLMTAKGFFPVEFAALCADRACRAARKACINLHTAIEQAAEENRLYNRCLLLTGRPAANVEELRRKRA